MKLFPRIQKNSSLREVNSGGDCTLTSTLKKYLNEAHNTGGSDVTEYKVTIWVDVKFYDEKKEKVLFQDNNIPAYAIYSVTKGESENEGQKKAIAKMVETISENTIAGW